MAAVLAVVEGDFLYRLQEQDLFLHSTLFFEQRLVTAGGMLTWMGSYLTQFFYYPALGAGLLCLLWVFIMMLQAKAFRLPVAWRPLSLVCIACLLLTVVDMGYWVFYLKLRGHAFDATLGTLFATALAWAFSALPRKHGQHLLFIPLTACIAYPLLGFYGLWATLLMGIMGWHDRPYRWASAALSALSIAVVPLACYHLLYHETNLVNIYWTALPVYAMRQESYWAYNLPFVALVACTMVMASGCLLPKNGSGRTGLLLRAAILTASAAAVVLGWYKDDNFHREMTMTRCMEQQDWNALLTTARSTKGEPTRAMCMMQNVALMRLGRQGDEMFAYPVGARRPEAPFPVRLVQMQGKQLYLQYGVPNYCYRWCMEDGVEYGWNVSILKLMLKCSLVNGELVAAQRFINMLKKTDFHRSWARRYEAYVQQPLLIAQDKELDAIRRLMRKDNFLTADMAQMERFLLEHFSTARSNNPVLQEQTLIASMQMKDMRLFWQMLLQYTQMHPGSQLPRHYQEAACLFGHLQNIDVSHMPFDRAVVQDYNEFAATMGRFQQQGMSIDQMRPLVTARFHTTYYYDFYFNRYQYIEQ